MDLRPWKAILILFLLTVGLSEGGRRKGRKKVRAGDEEFHKFRKKQYKKFKEKSSYTSVPFIIPEDAAFWYAEARARLQEQLRQKPIISQARNVVLVLGDGMSIATGTAARILKGQHSGRWETEKLSWEDFPYVSLLKTYTTDSQVADSAASATAYLCGVKGNLGTLGVDVHVSKQNCSAQRDTRFHVPSLVDWFQESGRSTGFVTTMRVTHATPAGAYAHVADREWEDDHEVTDDDEDAALCDDIAEQLVLKAPGRNIKVIMGGGRRNLLPQGVEDVEDDKKGSREDGKNLIRSWAEDKVKRGSSFRYVWNRNDLLATDFNNTDYLMGLFAHSHMDYVLDRDRIMDPSLTEMTEAALKILQKDSNGFFLLVEGGLIDHGHHGNKGQKALTETLEMDEAVSAVLRMTDPQNTLIVVTSDHSHSFSINGYPSRHMDILGIADFSDEDYLPYTTLLYGNGPGHETNSVGLRTNPKDDDLHDPDYRQTAAVPESSSAHGGDDVGLWAYGAHSHLFTGVFEQSYVPHAIAYAACVGSGPTYCGSERPRRNFPRNGRVVRRLNG